MAFDFPAAPTVGQQYTSADVTYEYNGYAWDVIDTEPTPIGGAMIHTDPPAGPTQAGSMWWESDTGRFYIWYDDSNTQQWVEVIGKGPKGDKGDPGDASASISFLAMPAGCGFDWWGPTAPPGTLLCFGQTVSRTTFAALFAIIGTAYNTGGEAGTDFRLPDCRGRAAAGKDDMGGTSANRLTTFNGDLLGSVGGAETHTLTTAQLASHAHTQAGTFTTGNDQQNHVHTVSATNATTGGTAYLFITNGSLTNNFPTSVEGASHNHTVTISGSTVAAGSGTAHNNVQPTIVCNKLITTGGV